MFPLIRLCEKIETKKLSKVSGTSRWVFHRDEIGLSPSLKHANLDELIDWSTAPIFSSEAGATILSTWKTSARLLTLKVNLTTCSGYLNVIFEEPQTIVAFGNNCKENKSEFMIDMVFIFHTRCKRKVWTYLYRNLFPILENQ